MNKNMPKDNINYLIVVLLVVITIFSVCNFVAIRNMSVTIHGVKDTVTALANMTALYYVEHDIEPDDDDSPVIAHEEDIDEEVDIEHHDIEVVIPDDLDSKWVDVDEDYIAEKYAFVNNFISQYPTNPNMIEFENELFVYHDQVCQQYDVSPYLMWAIYKGESTFQATVTSSGGDCRGLGQIQDGTGASMWEYLGYGSKSDYNPQDAYDPYINVDLTTALIRYHLDRNGNDMDSAIKSYRGSTLDSTNAAYVAKVKENAASLGIDVSNPLYN